MVAGFAEVLEVFEDDGCIGGVYAGGWYVDTHFEEVTGLTTVLDVLLEGVK